MKTRKGSSALKCAIDTEIKISQDGDTIKAKVEKQRDGRKDLTYHFQFCEHKVGEDEDGDAVYSCALQNITSQEKKLRLTGQAQKVKECLIDLILEEGTDHIPRKGMQQQKVVRLDRFREHFSKAHICKSDKADSVNKAFNRNRETLENKGYTAEWDGFIWLTDKADK